MNLKDEALEPLSNCSNLKYLNVSFCKLLTDKFLDALIESKC